MRSKNYDAAHRVGLSDGLDEELFRSHFDSLPGPAYIWRRDGDDFLLIAHNRAGVELGETRLESCLGKRASDLYAERPDLCADLRSCAKHTTVLRRETDYRFPTGVVRTYVLTYVPMQGNRVVCHADDVTDQRAAAHALERSEKRLRALFASNPDVVFRMTAAGTVLDMHVPAARFFPWSREELVGKTIGDFYGQEEQRRQVRYNREAIATGEVQLFEYPLQVGDRTMMLESRVAPAGDDEVVISVRDISDRVELERKLTVIGERERNRIGREIHDGLAQMLTGVKLLIEHLERRLRADGAAHAPEAAHAVEVVNSTITQARELVRGLSPIPEGTTLFQALDLLAQHSARYLGVRCTTDFAGRPLDIGEAVIAHLYRIAQEAITNAVRHGRASNIGLGCSVGSGEFALRVADDGSGFVVRPRPAADEGLGLKIMRYRARAIGGDLSIVAGPTGGTVLTCVCPLRTLEG